MDAVKSIATVKFNCVLNGNQREDLSKTTRNKADNAVQFGISMGLVVHWLFSMESQNTCYNLEGVMK